MQDRASCVYWIHAKHHTNIFKEGYVGITQKSVDKRWSGHKASFRCDKHNHILRRAYEKYGEDLVVEQIIVGSRTYCLDIEQKLRPKEYVGWNIASGGGGSVVTFGRKLSQRQIEILRACSIGKVVSDETRQKMSLAKKGKPSHPNSSLAVKKFMQEAHSWEHPSANKQVWLLADDIFNKYQSGKYKTRTDIAKTLGLDPRQIYRLMIQIESGWNPQSDGDWLKFSNTFKKEI